MHQLDFLDHYHGGGEYTEIIHTWMGLKETSRQVHIFASGSEMTSRVLVVHVLFRQDCLLYFVAHWGKLLGGR